LICRFCKSLRGLDQLLLVTDLSDGSRFFCCRPSEPRENAPTCFARLGPADRFRIELAIPSSDEGRAA
jgi:hypothetical protein